MRSGKGGKGREGKGDEVGPEDVVGSGAPEERDVWHFGEVGDEFGEKGEGGSRDVWEDGFPRGWDGD